MHWLIPFIDRNFYSIPANGTLGKVCKASHLWNDQQITLRIDGHCPECEKLRLCARKSKEAAREYSKAWYQRNRERVLLQLKTPETRARRTRNTQSYRRRRALRPCRSKHVELKDLKLPKEYKLTPRKAEIAADLLSNGHLCDAATLIPLVESCYQMEQVVAKAGKFPSVAQLVMIEQRRYWDENPEEARLHDRKRRLEYHRWRWMTDIEYRLYHRQKSKRRKAQMRNSTAYQLTGRQVRQRFAEFDHCCAYCGAKGDLHIEHLHPISKGGAHTLSNIVPACQTCNYSKHAHEVESWYRAQPFFTEQRWQAVCALTDAGLLSVPLQLGLPLAS